MAKEESRKYHKLTEQPITLALLHESSQLTMLALYQRLNLVQYTGIENSKSIPLFPILALERLQMVSPAGITETSAGLNSSQMIGQLVSMIRIFCILIVLESKSSFCKVINGLP